MLFLPLPNLLTIYWPRIGKRNLVLGIFWKISAEEKRGRVKWSGDLLPLWQEPHAYMSIRVRSGPLMYSSKNLKSSKIAKHAHYTIEGPSNEKDLLHRKRRWGKQYLCERAFGWGRNWIVQMKEVNCVAPPWGTASLRSSCLGKSTGEY